MKKGSSKRADPRQTTRFRVRSRDLPGYRAVTTDLSRTGIQLETDRAMTEATELDLDLEFDREDLRDFSCPARVVWCRQEKGSRHFRTGLVFVPETSEQVSALSRTATVLQARSESDLSTLLEEAKLLDPERSETFTRVRAASAEAFAAASAAGSPPAAKDGGVKRVLPLLGIYIPLRITIEGYSWDRLSGLLTVEFSDGKVKGHRLFFPACRLLTDYGCSSGATVGGLFCTPHSDVIKGLPKPGPGAGWKHYRFLVSDRQPLLELVSAPCQSRI